MRPHVAQHHFARHVCAGVVRDLLVGTAPLTTKDSLCFSYQPHLSLSYNISDATCGFNIMGHLPIMTGVNIQIRYLITDGLGLVNRFPRLLCSPAVSTWIVFFSLECTERCGYERHLWILKCISFLESSVLLRMFNKTRVYLSEYTNT